MDEDHHRCSDLRPRKRTAYRSSSYARHEGSSDRFKRWRHNGQDPRISRCAGYSVGLDRSEYTDRKDGIRGCDRDRRQGDERCNGSSKPGRNRFGRCRCTSDRWNGGWHRSGCSDRNGSIDRHSGNNDWWNGVCRRGFKSNAAHKRHRPGDCKNRSSRDKRVRCRTECWGRSRST